jgi:hypothetical protein
MIHVETLVRIDSDDASSPTLRDSATRVKSKIVIAEVRKF